MFTGLIEDVGSLLACNRAGQAAKLAVRTALPLETIAIGDSIAVNGACLTVEVKTSGTRTLTFHTLVETLRRTNLGGIPPGGRLNLERAMRMGDRLGGHLVSGHVDMVVPILSIGRAGDDIALRLPLPEALRPLVIPKGSIAVNGISLTIAELGEDSLAIHVIPHTWQKTNLGTAKPGDPVNIEADMVGKYILRAQACAGERRGSGVTWETLAGAGFVD